jgi:hypothetical protein
MPVGIANLSVDQLEALGNAIDMMRAARPRGVSVAQHAENQKNYTSINTGLTGMYPRSAREKSSDYAARVFEAVRMWQEQYAGNLLPGFTMYFVMSSYDKRSGSEWLTPYIVFEGELVMFVRMSELLRGEESVNKYGRPAFKLTGGGYSKTAAFASDISSYLFGRENLIRDEEI